MDVGLSHMYNLYLRKIALIYSHYLAAYYVISVRLSP